MSVLGVLGVVFIIVGMLIGYGVNKEKLPEEELSQEPPKVEKPRSKAELKALERWFSDEEY
jgi:uncharacterized protein YneF (UPF0154 family)